jgi:glycosyltransferase involved in cell wall biosynthesis
MAGDPRPLVAVVTPVYNGAPYFEITVESVQRQTYPNIVHVILDNASTDDTPDVIARLQGPIPVKTARNSAVLSQMDNWNAALGMVPADARYVKLQCADDLMRPDAIAKLVACAEGNAEVDYVTARDVYNGRLMENGLDPHRAYMSGREFIREHMMGRSNWHPWPHMFFRATPERLNKPFDPNRAGGDVDIVMRLLADRMIGVVNEPLFYTRAHPNTETWRMGGFAVQAYGNLERLLIYGPKFLSAEDFRHARREHLNLVMRHVIRWRLRGQGSRANEILQALERDFGIRLTPADFAAALATWPANKLGKTVRSAAHKLVRPTKYINESAYLGA